MKKENKKKDWEKEFDERKKGGSNYSQTPYWEEASLNMNWEGIKSFIRQLLEEKDQEWRDKIRKMKKIATETK